MICLDRKTAREVFLTFWADQHPFDRMLKSQEQSHAEAFDAGWEACEAALLHSNAPKEGGSP